MEDSNYASFEENDRKVLEELKNVTVSEKLIDSPMTPGQHLKCKFIKFCK